LNFLVWLLLFMSLVRLPLFSRVLLLLLFSQVVPPLLFSQVVPPLLFSQVVPLLLFSQVVPLFLFSRVLALLLFTRVLALLLFHRQLLLLSSGQTGFEILAQPTGRATASEKLTHVQNMAKHRHAFFNGIVLFCYYLLQTVGAFFQYHVRGFLLRPDTILAICLNR
jgi:hypothetical protein